MSNIESCVLEKLNYDSQGNLTPFETPVITQIGEFGTIILNLKPSNPSEIKVFPNAKNGLYNANVQEYRYVEGNPLVGQFTYDANASALVFNNSEVGNHIMANINAIGKTFMSGKSVAIKYDSNNQVIETLDTAIESLETGMRNKAESDMVFSYNFLPQSSLPSKQMHSNSTNKIISKIDSRTIQVIQKTNKGYMKYIYNDKYCVPTDNSNYGGSAELIRLIDARNMINCCVWKDVSQPKSGTVTQYIAPSLGTNVVESSLMDLTNKQDNRSVSSKTGNVGMGVYSIRYGTSVEYDMNYTMQRKANLVYMGTQGSVSEVDIYVNEVKVKTFNPKQYLSTGTSNYIGIVEFEVPTKPQTSTYTVKIEAKGNLGLFYFSCFNFYELKDFDGQYVDGWKAYGSIYGVSYLTTGANDYAMADENNRWFGSYHGGEVLDSCQMLWINTNNFVKRESDLYYTQFSSISVGEWKIFNKQFDMRLRTSLINKAKMSTIYDFSEDGTVNMKFSLENSFNIPIKFNAFFTALTCTSSSFNIINMPQYIDLGSDLPSSSREIKLELNDGFVSQIDTTNKLQLNIRFDKFNYLNNKRGCYVLDSAYYRKFYYGVVTNTQNVIIPSLQFSKSLDFIVR